MQNAKIQDLRKTAGPRAFVHLEGCKSSSLHKRAAEYPSIEEQLDDIYHNGVDGWKTTIKAVKDKYPKE